MRTYKCTSNTPLSVAYDYVVITPRVMDVLEALGVLRRELLYIPYAGIRLGKSDVLIIHAFPRSILDDAEKGFVHIEEVENILPVWWVNEIPLNAENPDWDRLPQDIVGAAKRLWEILRKEGSLYGASCGIGG